MGENYILAGVGPGIGAIHSVYSEAKLSDTALYVGRLVQRERGPSRGNAW